MFTLHTLVVFIVSFILTCAGFAFSWVIVEMGRFVIYLDVYRPRNDPSLPFLDNQRVRRLHVLILALLIGTGSLGCGRRACWFGFDDSGVPACMCSDLLPGLVVTVVIAIGVGVVVAVVVGLAILAGSAIVTAIEESKEE